jgi:hypothetical protein
MSATRLAASAPPRDAFGAGLLLFVGLRLALLMVLPLEAAFGYGDFQHYYNLSAWSVPGHCPAGDLACLPLIHYWFEFPPIFPYLSIGILNLIGGGGLVPFHSYAYALAAVMLAADVGVFTILRRLARLVHGPEASDFVIWTYALMPAPLLLGRWSFDGLTTLWMLAGLWALLARRDALAAFAIAGGILTKFVPALLLAVVLAARGWRRALAICAGVALMVLLGLAPFLLRAPAVTIASLQAQAAKSSYATVWAILDGNLVTANGQPVTGNFGPLPERFDLAMATTPVNKPSLVPVWLTLAAAAGIGLPFFLITRRRLAAIRVEECGAETRRQAVVFFAFTWAVFLLWSKGWSPQWQQMLVPLILLVHPHRTGALFALLLAAVSFLEWPVLLSRGLADASVWTILLRTGLIAGWAASLGGMLLRRSAESPP